MGLTRIRAQQISDIDYKQAVRVATDSDITLSGGAPVVVDGVTLLANNRVLVRAQSNAAQNGLYYVSTLGTGSNGTWMRTSDGNQDGEIDPGMVVMVTEGTAYADTPWKLITNGNIEIGTTELTFEQFGSAGAVPGGANTQIQFNNNNTFGGSANLTWNGSELYVNGTANIANLSILGNVTTTANVSANYFLGNGSQLTGIQAGATTTFGSTAPVGPAQGDIWIDADTAVQYIYFNDGTSNQWAEMEAQTSIAPAADLSAVSQNIIPSANVTYDLGSATYRWRDIYLSGNTINLGGATIKTDAASGAIALIPEPTEANPNPSGMVVSPSGGITVVATVGGEVSGNAIGNAAASPTAAPVPIDITTTPPTNGQALIWDSANSEFVPGNVGGGGITTGKAIAIALVFGG